MKKLMTLALLFLLTIPAAIAALKPEDIKFREGGPQRYNEYFYDPRVQDKKFDVNVHLTPVEAPVFARGYPHYYPRGTAWVQSVRSQYNSHGAVTVSVKDLRPSYYDNTHYQAWLYDADSGYTLNLGKFEAVGGGVAEMKFRGSYYFDAYDYVLITREPRDDTDPRPSNDEVLIGKILFRKLYEPLPLLGERAQYGYSYYAD